MDKQGAQAKQRAGRGDEAKILILMQTLKGSDCRLMMTGRHEILI